MRKNRKEKEKKKKKIRIIKKKIIRRRIKKKVQWKNILINELKGKIKVKLIDSISTTPHLPKYITIDLLPAVNDGDSLGPLQHQD